ncbi:MAG: ATP-dependent DNA helicase, partial [Planctomycetota bacterium]|nr:ATP-dependent DNA helicase [Planctomycetota bacterium]
MYFERMDYPRRDVYRVLRETFGHEEFRLGQVDVVRSILLARQTIAVLPTGLGKSLCYQLPALLFPGTSLVISPLIALMRDQVLALRARGISAAALHSNQSTAERGAVERALRAGELKLLYVSPERLGSPRFLDLLESARIEFVAVDEAHCVVRWGHEFRKAYLEIGPFLKQLRPRYIAAFTATATPELREDLGEALGFDDPTIFVRGFHRENLRLATERAASDDARLARLLELTRGREGPAPALVYVATRAGSEEAATHLCKNGLRAAHYHGGCAADARRAAQDAFLADELDALVATNAFGMGVDKPDIRLLIHLSLPGSFEDYYQEVGRAGRDGNPAETMLLWRGRDYRTRSFLAEQQESALAREGALRRLNRFYVAARGRGCLWRSILEYFGDPKAGELGHGCGTCARCRDGRSELHAVSGEEHRAALDVLTGVDELHGRFGRKKVAGILKGSKAQGVPNWPGCFGSLARLSIPTIEEWLQRLLDAGYLQIFGTEYPVLGISGTGVEALGGKIDVSVHGSEEPAAPPDYSDADPRLVRALKAWRTELARDVGLPAYTILHDKTLHALAALRPKT